jgi:flagellar operon protein
MIDELNFLPQPLGPIGPGGAKTGGAAKPTTGPSFSQVLEQADTKLKLSAHAQQRLNSRNIQLTQNDWDKINQAVDKAAAKGAREALVLTDKAGLVVSIKNRTVITAVDPASLKENVFTNIDSAVIV